MPEKLEKTEEQWREELDPQRFHILREKGTEPPFTGAYTYSKADGMYRCGACGALLFSVVRGGDFVHVAMGSLVDAPSIRPTEHIFVGSKAPWFEITDDLPQHEELD